MGLDTDKWFVLSLVFFFFSSHVLNCYTDTEAHTKKPRGFVWLVRDLGNGIKINGHLNHGWRSSWKKIAFSIVLFMFRELSKRIWIINASFILIISSLKIKSARISNFQCAWWWNWCVSFFLTDYFYYVANKAILQLLNFRAISHFTRYLFKAGLRNRRYENSTR